MSANLYAQFKALALRSGKTAVETPDTGHFSFAALNDLSSQLAGRLRDCGVQPGDRVAVKVEKSPQALALYLACLRYGAIFLPMNTAYTADETRYIIDDASPALFVHDPAEIAKVKCATVTLNAGGEGSLMAQPSAHFEAIHTATKDTIATILYTSGTTGRPKGAMLSHGNLSSNARTLAEAWHFDEGDTLLHALPIFHAHGLFVAVNIAFLTGCTMIFLPQFDVGKILNALPRASAYMGVPTHYVRLLKHPDFTKENTAHIRLFVSGSAPLLPETFKAFENRTGHRILERYGMTETVMNCSNPYDGPRIPGTVGPPLPGIQARITSDDGTILSPGEIGVLEVRGPNVFKGYWNKPEATKDAFRKDGFFITGDLAHSDNNGVIHLAGRAKDMIITGGFNVYPLEIEETLNAQSNIEESAVIGIPHPDYGEAVVAILTGQDTEEATLKTVLSGRLANYKIPKRFIFAKELPRNTMGKVEKAKLRRDYAALFQQ